MKNIFLTKNKVALVDDDDYEWINKWKWHFDHGYASRSDYADDGKSIKIYMHRQINKTLLGMQTDHKNKDGLDNRKSNLRTCCKSQNMSNRKIQLNNTSGYKGVYWHKYARKWMASIKVNKKPIYLGLFVDPIEAALAYDKNAVEKFGEFADTNF